MQVGEVASLIKQIQESNDKLVKTMMEEGKRREAQLENQLEKQSEIIYELKREMQSLGTGATGNNSSVALQRDTLTIKETADQLKEARANVPKLKKLPKSNHIEFIKKLANMLELKKGMKQFLEDVHNKTTAEVEIVKKENQAKLNAVKLDKEGAISDEEAINFWVFLSSKMDDGGYEALLIVPAEIEDKPKKRLAKIWENIMREFQTNDEHMRDCVYEYWNDLKQDDDEKFRDYVVRTQDLAKEVNEKFKLAGVSAEKVTTDDVKRKLKFKMTQAQKELFAAKLESMTSSRETYGLQEFITMLTAKEREVDGAARLAQQHGDNLAVLGLMARTNKPKISAGSSPFFTGRFNSEQAKGTVCWKFNGVPDSCPYGSTCRFAHITNPTERAKALEEAKARARNFGYRINNNNNNNNNNNMQQ